MVLGNRHNRATRDLYRLLACVTLALLPAFTPIYGKAFAQYGQAGASVQLTITEIRVEGMQLYSEDLVRVTSGLAPGRTYSLNEFQDATSRAVRQLWRLGLFSDVQLYGIQTEGTNDLVLIIRVEELPSLSTITFKGNDALKRKKLLEAWRIREGSTIGPNRVADGVERIRTKYREEGYLRADIASEILPANADSTRVNVVLTVDEGPKVGIGRIVIEGNEALSDRQLRKTMETGTGFLFLSRGKYDRSVVEQDKDRIAERYAEAGYLDARVVSDSLAFSKDGKKLTLILRVNEGEPYFLRSLSWEGVSVLDMDKVEAVQMIRGGQRFNRAKLMETLAAVQALYFDEGYVYAQIDPQSYFDAEEGRRVVDVVMRVVENEPARVAHINIFGNTKTKDHVIRREILLKPGDIFSRTRFERSLREVMALNFFANVELDPPPSPTPRGDLDVSIKVTEKPTGQATMGAGFSERDGLIGNIGLSLPNLFGNGQALSFTWDFGRIRRTIQFGFTEPWLFNTPTLVGFNVYNSEFFWTTFYKQKRRGGSVRVGRRLRWPDDYFRTSLSYRLEDIIFGDFSESYNPSPAFDLRRFDWPIRGSALSWTITRDSRDRPEFPTQGSINSLRVEVAGGPFGGDQQYVKWDLSQSFFFPSWWNFVMNMRIRAGLVQEFSGWGREGFVPFNEKYLPGGTSFDGQIRGYDNRRVGPLDRDGLEVGGQSLLIISLEYTFPIAPEQSLFGLVFADAGNAWLDLADTDPFDLRRSVGVGVRMFTPLVGLIGFDFAYGFDHFENGRRVGRWMPHFQFGAQFF